jgi:hypothetical protein
MGKSRKTLATALGIRKEQPEHLKGLAAKGAGKATRFKPGDERLKKNQGGRKQIVAASSILKARNRVSEILKELQEQPIAQELGKLMGLPKDATVAQAVAYALVFEALQGDVNAIKHLQLNTENLRDGAPALVGPPPALNISFVNTRTIEPPTIEAPTIEVKPLPPFAVDKKENEDGRNEN